MQQKINRDLLASTPAKSVANASIAVLNSLQDLPPQVQVMAAAAVFSLLCERAEVRPMELLGFAQNLIVGVEGKRPEFRAVAEYIDKEL